MASRGLKTSARLSDVPIGNAATAKNGVIPTSAGYKKFNALQLKLMVQHRISIISAFSEEFHTCKAFLIIKLPTLG